MKVLNKISDIVEEAVLALSVVITLTVFVVTVLQVVVRKLGGSISWAEELSRHLVLILIFWGAAVGARRGDSIRVGVVIDHLGPKVRKWVEVAMYTVVLGLMCVVTYSMYLGITTNLGDQTLGIMTFIKLSWVYWIIFAALVMLDLNTIVYILNVALYGMPKSEVEELAEMDMFEEKVADDGTENNNTQKGDKK